MKQIENGSTWVVNMEAEVPYNYVYDTWLEKHTLALKCSVSLSLYKFLQKTYSFITSNNKSFIKATLLIPVTLTHNICNRIMHYTARGIEWGFTGE